MVPSSSGLGHRPLTAVTRVQISLGSPFQTAGTKTAVFLLYIKHLTEFECCKFENCILGEFSELVCLYFLVFQWFVWVGISLGLGIIIYPKPVLKPPKIKVFDVTDDLFWLLNFFQLKQYLFKKFHFLSCTYNALDRKWLQPFLVGYVFTTYDIAKSKVILIYFGLYVFLNLDYIRLN